MKGRKMMSQHTAAPGGGWPRVGLAALALGLAFVGVWATLAPESWFATFPAPGHPWVALLPPYNEHLVRNVGELNLSFVVLLTWAAVSLERRLVQAVLVAYLVFAVPHFIYHAGHLMHVPPGDAYAQIIGMLVFIALPLALLATLGRRPLPGADT